MGCRKRGRGAGYRSGEYTGPDLAGARCATGARRSGRPQITTAESCEAHAPARADRSGLEVRGALMEIVLRWGRRFRLPMIAFICLAAATSVHAQQPSDARYTRTDHMIPMRDGVRLYTQVFAPQGAEKLPILLIRTPYGTGQLDSPRLIAAMPELTADGYIFVMQDIRGRFKSEGQFVMLRQPRDPKDKNAIDESTDTYDSIEWLLQHVPNNNGRVGMAGTSYGAWLTVMGMLDPHPALHAAIPQASPADMWIGDDFHHNGAFRLSYGFEYAYRMESSKEISDVSTVIDTFDVYDWYLRLGPLSNIDASYIHNRLS